jgi:drug/metabolite transporter (DMT)-like permease
MKKTPISPVFLPIHLVLLCVVTIWGTNVVMIKYLTNFFTPSALAALRMTTASVLLVPLVYRRYGWLKLTRREWLPITGIALCSITLHQLALSWGLAKTSGTHGVLILALNPLFTTILAARFANEPFSYDKALGIVLGLSGIFLIVIRYGNASGTGLWGDCLMFCAVLLYVIGTLWVKNSMAAVPPLVVTAYSHIVGSLGLLLIASTTAPLWVTAPVTDFVPQAVFLCSAWGATALGAYGWNKSIQCIGASTTSLFLNVSTVVGIISSAIFLHELLSWYHFLSLLLVLTGVFLGAGGLRRAMRILCLARQTED